MQILTNNKLCMFYGTIEKGIYDADPSRELYKITHQDGEVMYAVTSGFELYEVDSIPDDFEIGKYCYTSELGFYPNSDYREPIDIEETVREQKEQISEINENISAIAEGISKITGGAINE